jgi:gliding motility-associated-like protein
MPSLLQSVRTALAALTLLALTGSLRAQPIIFPFTSGPIPPCDTSIFTADVNVFGTLAPWGTGWGFYSIVGLTLNITTDHPEFLQISLTSPEGTTLLLSAFNGAGGQNYTNTNLSGGNPSITTGTAPFTGWFEPQGGDFSVFDWENAGGTWTITVIDTACAGGPNPGTGNPDGSGWNPGWFDGSSNNGGFTIAFDAPPPPCIVDMGWYNDAFCPGGTVDVLSPFLGNWWWDPSAIISVYWNGWQLVADPYAVNQAGTYNIEVWDQLNGCTYFGYVNVGSPALIDLGPDINFIQCDAAAVNLPAMFNTTGVTQVWTFNGQAISAAQAAQASQPGMYELIATYAGYCGDTALVNLSFGAADALGPDQATSLCPGASVDLTGLFMTTGLQTDWYLNGVLFTTPESVDQPGDYELISTTTDGCTDTAIVSVAQSPGVDLGPDIQVSSCSNLAFDLSSAFPSASINNVWTYNGAPVLDPSAVSAAGDYVLYSSNADGCSDLAIATLSVSSAPQLGADVQASICDGEDFDLTAAIPASGLSAGWSLIGNPVSDPTAASSAGNYVVIATDAAGCGDTAVVSLILLPNPILGPDQQVTACDNTSVDLTTLYNTAGSSTDWTLNGASITDPSTVTDAGSYTLTATNPAGCSSTAIATVLFNTAPSLGVDADASICLGDSMDLTTLFALAGLTSDWTLDGTATGTPTAANAPGEYQVIAANGFSCTDTALVSFTVNPNPELGPDQAYTLCPWQSVDLSAVFPVSGLSVTYTLNGIAVADPTTVADSGAFIVAVVDPFGCTDSAFALIDTTFCACEADFAFEGRCIQEPARFTLIADSIIVAAQWDFSGFAPQSTAIDPEVMMNGEGEVIVTVVAELACGTDTLQQSFMVYDCTDSCSIWIPNAFSPNSDDENDAWAWVGECDPEEFRIMVFNRWGELIYETEDPEKKWDGMYNGTLSQDGVYVYRAFYKLPYQEERSVIGHVTLLR